MHLGEQAPKRIAAVGNLDLLTSKPLALICSVKCPGNIILKTYDLAQKLREAGAPVIGGFHSPMERECLRILLRGSQPVIVCPARGLHGMRIPSEHKPALEEGRLLYVSPFSDKLCRATIETALFRNRFVAALAERIIVPYAAPNSKTFELCLLITSWGRAVYTLTDEANGALLKIGAQPVDTSGAIPGLTGW
jgi:predicted Rossmann fold nucleotide-binding protein DprA/Smf involved in DNA uptake